MPPLPILRAASGGYPRVPFPEDQFVGQPLQLTVNYYLPTGGGVAHRKWLLDCLSLQAAHLRDQLMANDLSILPALHRCLYLARPILVIAHYLTTCPPRLDDQG
ncbi:MAG: hypothetical protein WBN89_15950 [Prochlorococcaceae cyanobacterium]